MADARVRPEIHVLGDGDRLAADLQLLRVIRLTEQDVPAHEQDVAVREPGVVRSGRSGRRSCGASSAVMKTP